MNAATVRQNSSAEQVYKMFGHRLLFHSLQGYRTSDDACPSAWAGKIIQLTDKALQQTHGFPGALGFLHLHDCVRRYPHPLESALHLLCVEWAAAAIMMHDMAKIYWGQSGSTGGSPEYPFLRLRSSHDPLSALVTFVDVIQEFERPTVSYGITNNGVVTIDYGKACQSTEMTIDSSGELTLTYNMTDDKMLAQKRLYIAGDQYCYFDRQHGYLDLSALGSDRSG